MAYNHNQIITWLEKKFPKEDGYKVYRNLEDISTLRAVFEEEPKPPIDPRLPVDLIYVQETKEKTVYTIFLVSSIKGISENLKNRLFFYYFYLSRIMPSKTLKISLVIPYEKRPKLKFFKENGFGLWMVKGVEDIKDVYEVVKAKSRRDMMVEEFRECDYSPALGEVKLLEKSEDIARFFDKYIHDAVDAIAGVTPAQFGEKYIDRTLLDKMFELKKVSYRKKLSDLVNEHLTEKGDDYEFVSEVFSKLWEECTGIHYTNFLDTFEPALQHVFAETRKGGRIYRDHYIHQFQVFLSGLYIIDKLYDNFVEKHKKPEICWLIISSFHDMAYPVQLYDAWSGKFFKEIFDVPKGIAHIELKSKFVEESFMSCTGSLIERLCRVFGKEELKGNWLAEKNNLVQFFYKGITEAKNHCILSSISLLKIIKDPKYKNKLMKKIKINGDKIKFQNILDHIFIPSALALALHDQEVWQELKKIGSLSVLKFKDDPLSFLLIFCDNIQEWGRPSKSQIEGERMTKEKKFLLKDLKYDPTIGFDITVWSPTHTKTEKFFKDMQDNLKGIESFLQQPKNREFAVHLRDKDGKGEDFSMKGPPS